MSSYQMNNGYQYQNIPSAEQDQHHHPPPDAAAQQHQPYHEPNHTSSTSGTTNSTATTMEHGSYSNDRQTPQDPRLQGNYYQQQYTQQQSYPMSSYQEYVQNMNIHSYGSRNPGAAPASFGSHFGNGGGFTDWSFYGDRYKMNRFFLMVATGLFILFVISHPAVQPEASIGKNYTVATSEEAEQHANIGIAGDGHHNNNDAAPPAVTVITHDDKKEGDDVSFPADVNADADADADHMGDRDLPQINYMLAYPMSGVYITMFVISRSTNTTVGTNVAANAFVDPSGNPIPVFPTLPQAPQVPSDGTTGIHSGSPFFWSFETHPVTPKVDKTFLTYSPCDGYCMYPCTPDQYIRTEAVFEEACRTIVGKGQPEPSPSPVVSMIPKSSNQTNKVIHLIRDPFSNVVSRFHAHLRDQKGENYPDDSNGFHAWCSEMDKDDNLLKLEMASPLIPYQVKELMKSVPCHGEFYKYISWHNHVVEMVWNEEYPSLQVYYEDYSTSEQYHQQAIKISEFLEQPIVSSSFELNGFQVRNYGAYFTGSEQQNIEKLLRAVAYKKTMTLLER